MTTLELINGLQITSLISLRTHIIHDWFFAWYELEEKKRGMKSLPFILMLIFMVYSCNNTNIKEDVNQIEQQLAQVQSEAKALANKKKQEMAVLQLYKNVKTNLHSMR